MSLQATFERFKEIQVTTKEFRAGVVGLFAGLVLGLLIGWVFWPVDWQGGSVDTLSRDAQVDYLGAVADAYAGAPAAIGLARQRLAPLTAELPALFDEAVARAAGQPDGAAQVANLALLASALGIQLSSLPTVAVPAATMAAASGETAPATGGGNAWTSFLLAILGIVAVGGGLYLLWSYYLADVLRQKRAEAERPLRTTSARTETGETINAYNAGTASRRAGAAVYRTAQAEATKVTPTKPPTMDDVPPFDDDDIASTASPPAAPKPQEASFGPSVAVSASTVASTPDAFTEDIEEWEDANDKAQITDAPADLPPTQAASSQRTTTTPGGWMVGASRVERYQTIDRFHAEFVAGMPTFDWAKHIPKPGDDGYAGEYGAGVSERHGMLNNDPEQVVALEVYIFDKSEDKNVDTVSRIVLSEYADTHLRKQFERERDRLGPIVAQPKTTLQLETRHFVLVCFITDVVYSEEGIFKHVVMDMELKKKN